jgi:outer membrane protein assembly factor BamB
MQSMQTVKELARFPSPGGRPQPLAFHDGKLWVGCWDTSRIYALDPATGAVVDQVEAPGKPYGLAAYGATLRAVISHGEQDDRYLYTFAPGQGFDMESKIACPDLTGSHLTSDGTDLYLVQMSYRRILLIDATASVRRTVKLPSACAGICATAGTFHAITTEDDFDTLQFATLDIASNEARFALVATVPPEARALALDGTAWWTSLREEGHIVSFVP